MVVADDDYSRMSEPVSNSGELASSTTNSQVRFPRNAQPISVINGTPSAVPSNGTTAAAFILSDPSRATATSTFIQPRATLYGSLSNGTSGGNFILVSPFIDVSRA